MEVACEVVKEHVSSRSSDRVAERRRAVALARHFREVEGLSIAQIAERLGRSPATIKAYFYDPTGDKARAVKARYVGVCRGCGAYTQARNGKGDAYGWGRASHPGSIERRWTRGLVLDAMRPRLAWYERLPSWYDSSRAHAARRGGEPLAAFSRPSRLLPFTRGCRSSPRPQSSYWRRAGGVRGSRSDLLWL